MNAKLGLTLSLALLLTVPHAALAAAPTDPISKQPIAPGGPDLKTTLEKGLKARRPVEFEFIKHVVDLVNRGKIPISLVETDFLYARKKQPYPMPYFIRVVQIQAQKLGVKIDGPPPPASQ